MRNCSRTIPQKELRQAIADEYQAWRKRVQWHDGFFSPIMPAGSRLAAFFVSRQWIRTEVSRRTGRLVNESLSIEISCDRSKHVARVTCPELSAGIAHDPTTFAIVYFAGAKNNTHGWFIARNRSGPVLIQERKKNMEKNIRPFAQNRRCEKKTTETRRTIINTPTTGLPPWNKIQFPPTEPSFAFETSIRVRRIADFSPTQFLIHLTLR